MTKKSQHLGREARGAHYGGARAPAQEARDQGAGFQHTTACSDPNCVPEQNSKVCLGYRNTHIKNVSFFIIFLPKGRKAYDILSFSQN